MWRGAIAGLLVYLYGYPPLEAARPAVLNLPLQNFHREINGVAVSAYRAVRRIDNQRTIGAVKDYAEHLNMQLRLD